MKTSKRGMTLTEVILAMAILGIVAIAVLPLFASGYMAIAKAGNIIDATFQAAGEAEISLSAKDVDDSEDNKLSFVLDGNIYTPDGHIKQIDVTIKNSNVIVSYFLPAH